jgi:LacI family transcriptional regulator
LVQNKFTNIGFITTASDQSQMKGRLSGYEKAILEMGLKPNTLQIPFNEIIKGKGKDYIYNFLEQNKDLDAVFFATNYLAQSGLEVFKENNPRLVKDLGIIAFDDNDMFKIYDPSITSVSQPLQEISAKLMDLMLPLLKKKEGNEINHKIMLKTELIIRESSLLK